MITWSIEWNWNLQLHIQYPCKSKYRVSINTVLWDMWPLRVVLMLASYLNGLYFVLNSYSSINVNFDRINFLKFKVDAKSIWPLSNQWAQRAYATFVMYHRLRNWKFVFYRDEDDEFVSEGSHYDALYAQDQVSSVKCV
jgi:hypothetical protein